MGAVIPLNKEAPTFEEYLAQHPDIREANVALQALARHAWEAGKKVTDKALYDRGYSVGFDHGHALGIVRPEGASC
jgi:hypothetical protein